MQIKKKGELIWLEYDLLRNHPIKHGVFLRHGGRSCKPFHSLNLSDGIGDDPKVVQHNRQSVCNALEIPELVSAKQCHGTQLHEVIASPGCILEGDALATNVADIGLMITHADCQAAIFYDPVKHVVANIHAGWRGSVQNIYGKSVQWMIDKYQTDPKNLLVCISPSLGPFDAEFIHYRKELPEEFWNFQVSPNYFDFWNISRHQLQNSGILAKNIEIAEISTRSNLSDYFSYRGEKITGRHGTIVSLL